MRPWTAIEHVPRLGNPLGIDLYLQRDDLYPYAGGGNKARKVEHIFEAEMSADIDAIVTVGSTQSNQARAVAMAAAARGLPCQLILHGNPAELKQPTGNLMLMLMCGANVTVVREKEISTAVDQAMQNLRRDGRTPMEIPGGLVSAMGARAFRIAVETLSREQRDFSPDCIILASGTGVTQAGLVGGARSVGWNSRIIGISVARSNPAGESSAQKTYDLFADAESDLLSEKIDFRDDWNGGGYGKFSSRTLEILRDIATSTGVVFDPIYTGKALRALIDLTKRGEISTGAKVLFWHTGGMLNLISAASQLHSIGLGASDRIHAI